MEDNFALRYVLKHPGVNSRAELVPSHGVSRRRLGDYCLSVRKIIFESRVGCDLVFFH
jgi:hypothetical protein